MTAYLLPEGKQSFTTSAGLPLVGGKVFTYAAGTSTQRPTWSDAAQTAVNTNPVILDGRGEAAIFWDGAYKVTLTDSADVVIWTVDSVQDGGGNSYATRALLKAQGMVSGAQAYLNEGLRAGEFVFNTANLSAQVTLDTREGIYIAPAAAPTGASGAWVRVWDGIMGAPEWFGADRNNGGTDSRAALQACIDVTNSMKLAATGYYIAGGLVGKAGTVIEGQGPLQSAIFVSHATDHCLRVRGVSGVSYVETPRFVNFALVRTVAAANPALEANDITQGHGIHLFMVSNPIVDNVYTYNNLVEIYCSNILTLMLRYIRSIRSIGGGAGDRWYGLYIDGVTGGGTFGGPSPNPSAHVSYMNMVGNLSIGRCFNYYVRGQNQDLWVDFFEAAEGHKQLFVDAAGANSGDTRFTNAVLDGYQTNGAHFLNVPQGASIELTGWIAPRAGATGDALRIENSHGITANIKGDCTQNTARRMLHVSDSSLLDLIIRAVGGISAAYAISMTHSRLSVLAHKAIGGGGANGSIVQAIGGSDSHITAAGNVTSQTWVAGVDTDATIDGYTIDVSAVATAAVTNRVTNAGVAVTTQGNIAWGGGRFCNVYNPRAGAML